MTIVNWVMYVFGMEMDDLDVEGEALAAFLREHSRSLSLSEGDIPAAADDPAGFLDSYDLGDEWEPSGAASLVKAAAESEHPGLLLVAARDFNGPATKGYVGVAASLRYPWDEGPDPNEGLSPERLERILQGYARELTASTAEIGEHALTRFG